jgi:hypothetical protein
MSVSAYSQNAQTSQGGFYTYKPGQLQKPAQSQYRPEIQIINTTPIVKDFTGDEEPGPSYVIPLPTHKQQGGGGVSVEGADGSPYTGRPGYVILKPQGSEGRILAKPGFESNMHALKNPQPALPGGQSVGVHGQLSQTASGPQPSALPRPASQPSHNQSTGTAPAQVLSYPKAQSSGSGSSSGSGKTTTNVTGVLKPHERFSLLNKH